MANERDSTADTPGADDYRSRRDQGDAAIRAAVDRVGTGTSHPTVQGAYARAIANHADAVAATYALSGPPAVVALAQAIAAADLATAAAQAAAFSAHAAADADDADANIARAATRLARCGTDLAYAAAALTCRTLARGSL